RRTSARLWVPERAAGAEPDAPGPPRALTAEGPEGTSLSTAHEVSDSTPRAKDLRSQSHADARSGTRRFAGLAFTATRRRLFFTIGSPGRLSSFTARKCFPRSPIANGMGTRVVEPGCGSSNAACPSSRGPSLNRATPREAGRDPWRDRKSVV